MQFAQMGTQNDGVFIGISGFKYGVILDIYVELQV